MFSNCNALATISANNVTVASSVTTMDNMFSYTSITNVDFLTSPVCTNFDYMFNGSKASGSISCRNLTIPTGATTTSMFGGKAAIVGSNFGRTANQVNASSLTVA